MPFKTKCPGCAKILDVPDSVAGKRVKCPACGQMWQVPAPTAAPPAAAAQPAALGAKCPGCGKAIQVPDSARGKRVKCPACAHVWQIPRPVVDAEPVPGTPGPAPPPASTQAVKKNEWFDDMMGDEYPIAKGQNISGATPFAGATPAAAAEPPRRPCPRCGEMIAIGAAKCRFCDAIFDEKLRKVKKKRRSSSSSSDDDDPSVLEWVICVLCSGIGCIVGIIYLIQGKPKGLKMLGVSLLFIIIWNIISFIIQSSVVPHHGFR
jgi:predicted RNA-binding Zn-ribbon protein involved in translation (DUF1610 family)/phage FluMu protein Com